MSVDHPGAGPCRRLVRVRQRGRRFGQLAGRLVVPDDFDAPLRGDVFDPT
jgi:hypothetical protein